MIEYMSPRRNQRVIRDDLTVYCNRCDTWKHITEFNGWNTGRIYCYIDYPDRTVSFGYPHGHCKSCLQAIRQAKAKAKRVRTHPISVHDSPGIVYKNGIPEDPCPEDFLIDNIVESIKTQQSTHKKSPLTDDNLKRMGYGSP